MPESDFTQRFRDLTGNAGAFPWQVELFRRFLANSVERSLDIPTGLGKTAVMAIWLLARAEGAAIPRRLVYVVDRRAVVDQATEVANTLREAVARDTTLRASLNLGARSLPISTLRGQHVDNKQWLEDPSSLAIIVGTIDMIGSRLLFEGYGVSRKMRPYHAGLLGADTLVVLDEAHLVPPFEMLLDAIASNSAGVAPRGEARAIVPQFKLMALSATGRTRSDRPFTLTDKDLKHPIVLKRLDAKKRLILKPLKPEEDLTAAQLDSLLAESLADEAWQIAERGTTAVRIIVFCNKRKVADAAKKALEQLAKTSDLADIKERTELFVGGRRVHERETAAARLKELGFIAGSKAPLIKPVFLFATSAGEVGVDLDADHMVSDLVEWERMIQRLGRVNRRGEGDAKVIVLVEPDPKPDKAVKTALAKKPDEREAKDTRVIETYQRKVEFAQAKQRPFTLLPQNEDKSIDGSPGALRNLKQSAEQNSSDSPDHDSHVRVWRGWLLAAATTPEPLRPALTRAIVDAWSMTSLKEHTGRPEVGSWLRGWIENDPPQTTVVWRRYLPSRSQGKVTRKEIEAFFEAAPPHTSESLETETDDVLAWLKKRAKSLIETKTKGSEIVLDRTQPVGFVLSPAGDLKGWFSFTSDGVEFSPASKRGRVDEDADKRALWNATLIVDARIAGLRDGLLDATEKAIPLTADGFDWLPPIDGEPVVKFRIRTIDPEAGGEHRSSEPQWRTRLRFPTACTEEGEASGWLIVEKWRSDSATEEDRAVGHCQLLEDHQRLAETRARELAKRLNLPEQYAEMLAIAARLHDEGKRATRWQRAFNAPTPGVFAKTLGPINFALLDGYRHEFSSLEVAARDAELLGLPKELQDLALHLIAAHHGFGRPIIGVSGCEDAPPSKLETRAREVAVRFARLQQDWGPWGLAWWESLLRAIDHQASRENDSAESDGPQEAVQ
jgi:CRISPR-associated endonuclease/helicase Cas3